MSCTGSTVVRVGLAGVPVLTGKVSASVLLPCRNVAMAATQIARLASRCKTHPQLKADPTLCSVAVYRGSWERPDVSFATDVADNRQEGRRAELRHAAWHPYGNFRRRRRSQR